MFKSTMSISFAFMGQTEVDTETFSREKFSYLALLLQVNFNLLLIS